MGQAGGRGAGYGEVALTGPWPLHRQACDPGLLQTLCGRQGADGEEPECGVDLGATVTQGAVWF